MTYRLDGIETAMEVTFKRVNGVLADSGTVSCPCGWFVRDACSPETYAALRFHYTHCEHARLTETQPHP